MVSRFPFLARAEGKAASVAFALIMSLALLSPAKAAGPWNKLLGGCRVDCVRKWCCDDYCPKKEPSVCVPLKYACDDYCPKQEPCVCVPLKFCGDDYCQKCLPPVCLPNRQPLKCVPACRTVIEKKPAAEDVAVMPPRMGQGLKK